MNGTERAKGELLALWLPTTLFGRECDPLLKAYPPPFRVPCELLAAELGLAIVGVPPSGVDCALSTRDFRDDERGVTLLFRNACTGVDNCSLDVVFLIAAAARSLCVDFRVSGGVALAASLGVIGDFTLRFVARVGFNGRFALFFALS